MELCGAAAAHRLNKHAGSRRVRTNAMLGIEFPHGSRSAPDELELLRAEPGKVFLSDPAFGK